MAFRKAGADGFGFEVLGVALRASPFAPVAFEPVCPRGFPGGRRYRVPDVCVVPWPEPDEQVFTQPPFICIEVLSRRDEISNVLEKLEEYGAAGVRYIWVVDPRRKKAFYYDGGLRAVTSGVLATTDEPLVELPLGDVFLGL